MKFKTACPEHDGGIVLKLKQPSGIPAGEDRSKIICVDAQRYYRKLRPLGRMTSAHSSESITVLPNCHQSRTCSSASADQCIPVVQVCLGQICQAAKRCRGAERVGDPDQAVVSWVIPLSFGCIGRKIGIPYEQPLPSWLSCPQRMSRDGWFDYLKLFLAVAT